ncbi:hypothetical protein CSKR_110565 [Clonorchis sinensis]|uniref:Uncharacterized protein n=2 Tax=Clonorchis sinensis TaxID=79923 RepID=G7YRP5_CLOSI|nr:hypothetical protein CSKR_110565 [Clonorchis sinensis]GAA55625.1 hypothetical protein CLF_108537 [Clonorchis sinensis]
MRKKPSRSAEFVQNFKALASLLYSLLALPINQLNPPWALSRRQYIGENKTSPCRTFVYRSNSPGYHARSCALAVIYFIPSSELPAMVQQLGDIAQEGLLSELADSQMVSKHSVLVSSTGIVSKRHRYQMYPHSVDLERTKREREFAEVRYSTQKPINKNLDIDPVYQPLQPLEYTVCSASPGCYVLDLLAQLSFEAKSSHQENSSNQYRTLTNLPNPECKYSKKWVEIRSSAHDVRHQIQTFLYCHVGGASSTSISELLNVRDDD